MKAIIESNKLPIGFTVRLMRICENCVEADLEIENNELYYDGQKVVEGIISCRNIYVCKRLLKMHEGVEHDS